MKNLTRWKDYQNKSYRSYTLFILSFAYCLNGIDRNILNILQEPIKNEFGLSDTHLGLLSGVSFAIFYSFFGLPIARWADRGTRTNIIAIAITLWSLMTAISGFAQSYLHLLLARIGVAVGESGASPPAHSMISDIYPPEFRATALSLYSIGITVGMLAGFVLGGWINDMFGWRMAFVIVGLPGILLAILIYFTISEPQRERAQSSEDDRASETFHSVLRFLFSKQSLVLICIASGAQAASGYAFVSWLAPYFIRTFDFSTSEAGLYVGLVLGIFGAFGVFMGGWLTDRLRSRSLGWYCWGPALASLIIIPAAVIGFLSENAFISMMLFWVPGMLIGFYLPASIAAMHNTVPPSMRATISAILFFIINLVGLGLGPLMVGILNDFLVGELSVDYLGDSILMVMLIFQTLACCLFFFAGKKLIVDTPT